MAEQQQKNDFTQQLQSRFFWKTFDIGRGFLFNLDVNKVVYRLGVISELVKDHCKSRNSSWVYPRKGFASEKDKIKVR